MSFLAPALLFALPLAALPVIIHLIHLYRRRVVPWAAMMFLLMAQQMNRGYSRLRQMLILAMRVLAVLGLLFVATRPLAGGWLGLTGGAPDAVIVLLDRSASMEQQNLNSGKSKRATALEKMSTAITDMFGTRTKVVLLDSATLDPTIIENAKALADIPATQATDTSADLPTMMQAALDYITANSLGRTDIWIASDLRQADWNAASGRWEALRAAFAKLEAVRFHLIAYPQQAEDNLSIVAEKVTRRETSDRAELLLDLRLTRQSSNPEPVEVPLQIVVNGTRTSTKVMLKDNELVLQGHSVPIDKATKRGWGRIELPADSNVRDNVFNFVFDQPAMPMSTIVSDDLEVIEPLKAVLASPIEPGTKQEVKVLPTSRVSEIDWDRNALVVWHAPLPEPSDILATQLKSHIEAGRSVIFLPVNGTPSSTAFAGIQWNEWKDVPKVENAAAIEWWRASDDLLANTRGGAPLPVGEIEVTRQCTLRGELTPLARMAGGEIALARSLSTQSGGGAWFCGVLPGSGQSSLARDGVVLYVMFQRALVAGSKTLGNAQQREASVKLVNAQAGWKNLETPDLPVSTLTGAVLANGDRLMAVNRPAREDSTLMINDDTVNELFSGLQFRRVNDTVENETSLANEIWRTFLLLMALAIIGEAILCMPSSRDRVRAESKREVLA